MPDTVVANVFRDAQPGLPAPPPPTGGVTVGPSWARWSQHRMLNTLRVVNCCNGLCLILVAIVCFLIPVATVSPAFDTITISAYTVFLGLVMSCVELNMGMFQERIRRNFGFLFSFVGRTAFIMFCASMSFAMGGKSAFICWIVGGLTALNGLFNAVVILTHPSFRTGELSASGDPWKQSKSAEAEVGAYLAARPDLVLKAASASATLLKDAHAASGGGGGGGSAGANPYSTALTVPAGSGGGYHATSSMAPGGGGGGGYADPAMMRHSYASSAAGGSAHGYVPGGGAGGAGGRGGTIRVQTVTTTQMTVMEYSGDLQAAAAHMPGLAQHGGSPHLMVAPDGTVHRSAGAPAGASGAFFNPYQQASMAALQMQQLQQMQQQQQPLELFPVPGAKGAIAGEASAPLALAAPAPPAAHTMADRVRAASSLGSAPPPAAAAPARGRAPSAATAASAAVFVPAPRPPPPPPPAEDEPPNPFL